MKTSKKKLGISLIFYEEFKIDKVAKSILFRQAFSDWIHNKSKAEVAYLYQEWLFNKKSSWVYASKACHTTKQSCLSIEY